MTSRLWLSSSYMQRPRAPAVICLLTSWQQMNCYSSSNVLKFVVLLVHVYLVQQWSSVSVSMPGLLTGMSSQMTCILLPPDTGNMLT